MNENHETKILILFGLTIYWFSNQENRTKRIAVVKAGTGITINTLAPHWRKKTLTERDRPNAVKVSNQNGELVKRKKITSLIQTG